MQIRMIVSMNRSSWISQYWVSKLIFNTNSVLVTFFLILQNLFLYLFWKIVRFFFFYFYFSFCLSEKSLNSHFLTNIRMWMVDHILILVKINLIRPIYTTWFTVYYLSYCIICLRGCLWLRFSRFFIGRHCKGPKCKHILDYTAMPMGFGIW